jgi:hypothetical protein
MTLINGPTNRSLQSHRLYQFLLCLKKSKDTGAQKIANIGYDGPIKHIAQFLI